MKKKKQLYIILPDFQAADNFHSFILSNYHVPATVLNVRDLMVSKTVYYPMCRKWMSQIYVILKEISKV